MGSYCFISQCYIAGCYMAKCYGKLLYGEMLYSEMLYGEMFYGKMLYGEMLLSHSRCLAPRQKRTIARAGWDIRSAYTLTLIFCLKYAIILINYERNLIRGHINSKIDNFFHPEFCP